MILLDICDSPDTLNVMRILKIILLLVRILIPIVLIVVMMFDFFNAVKNGEDYPIGKSLIIVAKRALILILIFSIPTIINIIIKIIDPSNDYVRCFDNATREGVELKYEEYMSSLVETAKEKRDYNSYNTAKIYLQNIKDEDKREQYSSELEIIKKEIEEKRKKEDNQQTEAQISYDGLDYSTFNSKIQNMGTPSYDEIKQAASKNGISEDYLKIVIGTTNNEGYIKDPYLYYGWSSAMLNNNYSLSTIYGWGGGTNFYSESNILKGYTNANSTVLKSVYLSLIYRNKKIIECNGMYSSTPSSYNLIYSSNAYSGIKIYEKK